MCLAMGRTGALAWLLGPLTLDRVGDRRETPDVLAPQRATGNRLLLRRAVNERSHSLLTGSGIGGKRLAVGMLKAHRPPPFAPFRGQPPPEVGIDVGIFSPIASKAADLLGHWRMTWITTSAFWNTQFQQPRPSMRTPVSSE